MEKKIEFKSGKETLRGSLFIPEGKGPFPGVVFFQGNGGKGEKYFEAGKKFAEVGIMALAFNYTGCGQSEGDYYEVKHEDIFKDALNAISFLLNQKEIDINMIGVVGGSFGGYVASIILPKIRIKSLVLLNASAHDDPLNAKFYMGTLADEVKYFETKNNWINSKSYENIANYSGPLLIIKSENDENVPSEVVDRYFEKAINSSKKEIIEIMGADHRLSTLEMRNKAFEIMIEWFKKTL